MINSIKQNYIIYRINSAKETLEAARLLAENKLIFINPEFIEIALRSIFNSRG